MKPRLEKTFTRALAPIEEFLHQESSSGIILIICTAAAIGIANSPLYPLYDRILHATIAIGGPGFSLSHSLHHWINDGLMALFFFVIGLEVKREILIGELSNIRQALLPISAALGGMILPAACYLLINPSGPATAGWGIPMATDIAFAVGIIALLGSRVPKALVAMLLALAIVDDIGAVLVIAIFYTPAINFGWLAAAASILLLMIGANLAGVRRVLPFAILGLLLWLAMLQSGIHATLAGVLGAFTIPARSAFDPVAFADQTTRLAADFRTNISPDTERSSLNVLKNAKKQAVLQSLENAVHKMESPLQRLEHHLHPWVSFLVIPIFALANAGVPIDFAQLGSILMQPVAMGIIAGLLVGKLVGIMFCSWLVITLKLSKLPAGVRLSQIAGISMLAGIGFTMSIFIATLAFGDQAELLLNAKIGIVFASLAAGVAGYGWLLKTTGQR